MRQVSLLRFVLSRRVDESGQDARLPRNPGAGEAVGPVHLEPDAPGATSAAST
jgi:hypothetical protein